MFYLRAFFGILGFVAASVYGIAIAVVRRDRSRVAHDYARALMRLVCPPLGIRSRISGREHLRQDQPCIYLANHQSMVDVPILAELYPPNTVIIGKKELRQIPLFGWLFEVTGNILIDRKNNSSAVGRMREAETAIQERKVNVWIFPEGTRATESGKLLPFKKGAFYMAAATGAPLVPIVVGPVRTLFDIQGRRSRPGTIEVRVLEPIRTTGLTDADVPELVRTTHQRMQVALTEMAERQGILPPPPPAPPLPSAEYGVRGGDGRP